MTYAIFLAIFATAAFCGYMLGRLSMVKQCKALLAKRDAEHVADRNKAVTDAKYAATKMCRHAQPDFSNNLRRR